MVIIIVINIFILLFTIIATTTNTCALTGSVAIFLLWFFLLSHFLLIFTRKRAIDRANLLPYFGHAFKANRSLSGDCAHSEFGHQFFDQCFFLVYSKLDEDAIQFPAPFSFWQHVLEIYLVWRSVPVPKSGRNKLKKK